MSGDASAQQVRDGAVKRIFSPGSAAPAHLARVLEDSYSAYAPLKLRVCSSNDTHVLACAPPCSPPEGVVEAWDEKYATVTYPGDAAEPPPVLFIRGLLIGTLSSDVSGALYITTARYPRGVQVVIAPPPSPNLNNAAIWIRDWRYIPARLFSSSDCSQGVFEVLQRDVVSLGAFELGLDKSWTRITSDFDLNQQHRVNVRGYVHAKSCIIASRKSSACFFVELIDDYGDGGPRLAATVIFRGDKAVKWWPFLEVGREVGITALTFSRLPSYQDRIVFKASGSSITVHEVNIEGREGDSQPGNGPHHRREQHGSASKRRRVDRQGLIARYNMARERPEDVKASSIKMHMVTFEGEISNILADGRFEMDGKAILHLGGFSGSRAGPGVASLCLRKGARIEATSVLVFLQPDRRVSLFPTARTVVNVLYFGSTAISPSTLSSVRWEHTPWRWLWKRWTCLDILFAEELFDSLIAKFRVWLMDEDERNSAKGAEGEGARVFRFLLGSEDETGLVQFTMHILTGRNDILRTTMPPSRNMYEEFLDPVPGIARHSGALDFPKIPCLHDILEYANLMWKDRVASRKTKPEPSHRIPSGSASHFFRERELRAAMVSNAYHSDSKQRCRKLQEIVLVGLLQGSARGDGQLILSDSSGSIEAQVIGYVPTFFLGAVVCVRSFFIIGETSQGISTRQFTLLFDPSEVRVIVDGPCVEMGQNGTAAAARRNSDRLMTQRDAALSRRLTQYELTQDGQRSTYPGIDGDGLVVDAPLVCIFVTKVLKGDECFEVCGRLIAVAKSREENEWYALDRSAKGFWSCSLMISGECALRLSPALQEHQLFAISCSELYGVAEPAAQLLKKAEMLSRQNRMLEISTVLRSKYPWVENLGRGYYMRFCALPYEFGKGQDHKKDFIASDDGAQYSYVIDAIEQFSTEYAAVVEKSFWKAYEWCGLAELETNKIISIRGVIVSFSLSSNGVSVPGASSTCVSALVLRDEVVEAFTITVRFYSSRAKPKGLALGMVIEMHNVERVPVQVRDRFEFVGNNATVVRVVTAPRLCEADRDCWNCQKPKKDLGSLGKVLPRKHIWHFSQPCEVAKHESCSSGLLRFDVLRIEKLSVWLAAEDRDCATCTARDQYGEQWNVGLSVLLSVDDGTAQCRLACSGFEKSCRLLRASDPERKALKRVALSFGNVEIDDVMAASALNVENGHGRSDEDYENLSIVYNLVKQARGLSSIGLVLNQTKVLASRSANAEIDEVVVKSFLIKQGRRLWTCCAPSFTVLLECVAVLSECSCKLKYSCNCHEHGLLKPIDKLQYLMAVEESLLQRDAESVS